MSEPAVHSDLPPPTDAVPLSAAAVAGDDEKVSTTFAPRTGRRIATVLVLIAIGLGGLYVNRHRPRVLLRKELEAAAREIHDRAPMVNVVHPLTAASIAELRLPGEARALYETTIYARTSGYLKSWEVDIGDHVKAGQLLAVIETPELDEQLAESRARVSALEADLQLAQAQLTFARLTSQRWDAAAPEGAVSQQERDEKAAQFQTAQAKLASAKAQLELGKAGVKRLELEVSFQRVLAPFEGVITQRRVDVGSLITAGSISNTTSLFTIAQSDQIRVFTKVPQSSAPRIKAGMDAGVTVREYPGHIFRGKVTRTAEAVDPASRTVNVEVVVPNPDQLLLSGMYVQVDFETTRERPPLIIHASALNLTSEGPKVAVVGPHHHLHFRPVKVNRDLGDAIEISEGLKAEDWVALNVSAELSEGDSVRPSPLANATLKVAASDAGRTHSEGSNNESEKPPSVVARGHERKP